MDVSDFRTLFGDDIRAWLDWDALDDENTRVEDLVVSSRQELGELYTVWHVDPEGNPGEWSHPQHRPQTLADAAAKQWPEDRQAKIEHLRQEFAEDSGPVQLTVPAYRAEGSLVVLDSNHRLVGAYLSGADLRVLLVVLNGPSSSLILPATAQIGNHRADRI
ncbi:hypothetical protein [Kocuria aegyptia]|uniref:ParB/Sulfiredoxin domain-containing protein n=1 Tax=Kocuria aegyptia TaxID=330943 RepID=A0ABP4XAJ7_9MICC